eukprot:TRINITY_DN112984_c0_g1_i1.p1 TRINITY_DN112984_c0_g1~~TRINITY_DN112984_c0_g1_i1.p1  ORF type:complete len:273 (+),score=57.69 TRINITY_DN112984_c0_g1_i1:111-929(+)
MERLLLLVALLHAAQASLNAVSGAASEAAAIKLDASADGASPVRDAQEAQHGKQTNELKPIAQEPTGDLLAAEADRLPAPSVSQSFSLKGLLLAPVRSDAQESVVATPVGEVSSSASVPVTDGQSSPTALSSHIVSFRASGNSAIIADAQPETTGAARIVQSVQDGLRHFGAELGDSSTIGGKAAGDTTGATTGNEAPSTGEEKPTFRLLHLALLFVVVPLALLLSKAGALRGCCSKSRSSSDELARSQRAKAWLEAWRSTKDRDMEIVSAF